MRYGRRMIKACAFALLLAACGSKSKPAETTEPTPSTGSAAPSAAGDCIKSGCSGIVCTEPGNEVMTTCEFKPEYACYQKATCERQSDGKCGWTKSGELDACLANPPAM